MFRCNCMSLKYFLYTVFVCTMLNTPVSADISDKYNLSAGTSLISFDSHINFNSRDDSVDQDIDLEDDLGLDSQSQVIWLNGMWRLTGRHRLRVVYMPFRRTSTKTLLSDIDVGDNTIKAGAFTNSSFETDILDINYLYSFHKTPEWESSIGVGLYWMKNRSEVLAEGVIINDNDGSEEFRSNFQTTQSFSAPLPLIGLSTSYELNSNIRIHGAIRYLDVEINDIAGRIMTLNFRADYFFTDHVGAGLSLSSFDLSVKRNGIVFNNELAWIYQGAQIFLVLRY